MSTQFQSFAANAELVRVLSPKQLVDRLGLSQCTLWRMRRRGELPNPISLSPGRVGWRESDIVAWLAAREQRRPS